MNDEMVIASSYLLRDIKLKKDFSLYSDEELITLVVEMGKTSPLYYGYDPDWVVNKLYDNHFKKRWVNPKTHCIRCKNTHYNCKTEEDCYYDLIKENKRLKQQIKKMERIINDI